MAEESSGGGGGYINDLVDYELYRIGQWVKEQGWPLEKDTPTSAQSEAYFKAHPDEYHRMVDNVMGATENLHKIGLDDSAIRRIASSVGTAPTGAAPAAAPASAPASAPAAAAPAPAGGLQMDVRAIQQKLADSGYHIVVDGIWGPQTQAAFNAYQAAQNAGSAGPRAGGSLSSGVAVGGSAAPGGGPGVAGGAPGPGATDDQIVQYIRQQYGYEAWMLDIPELRKVLLDGTRGGWDSARIQGALMATDWWKQHTSAQRAFAEAKANDPSAYDPKNPGSLWNKQKAAIAEEANRLGLSLTDDRLSQIVNDSLMNGWQPGDQILKNALFAEVSYNPSTPIKGDMAAYELQLRNTAHAYGMTLPDDALFNYAKDIAAGKNSIEGVTEAFRTQAKIMFAPFAAQIDAGITPEQLFAAYGSTVQNMLGTPQDQISWSDPKWQGLLFSTDPKGQVTPRSIFQVQQEIRTNPSYGWQNTPDSKNQGADLAKNILTEMGAVR